MLKLLPPPLALILHKQKYPVNTPVMNIWNTRCYWKKDLHIFSSIVVCSNLYWQVTPLLRISKDTFQYMCIVIGTQGLINPLCPSVKPKELRKDLRRLTCL